MIEKLKLLQFSSKEEIKELIKDLKIKDLHKLYEEWYGVENSLLRGNKAQIVDSFITVIQNAALHSVIMFHGDKEWDSVSNLTKCHITISNKYVELERIKYLVKHVEEKDLKSTLIFIFK